jgi:trk system potassium uptake protein TrkA
MRVVIAGSGRLGSKLASALASTGHDVTVVDCPMDRRRLGASFDGLTVEGNPIDREVLEQAGIRKADLFVAATSDDNVNAAAVQAAKGFFSVPRSIARFVDPERERFYRGLGIDAVCPTTSGLNQILDYIRTGSLSSSDSKIDRDLVCIHPSEEWIGESPRGLRLPSGRRIIGLVRDGRVFDSEDAPPIDEGDSLLVS